MIDFTRIIWVSEKARELWEPRLGAVSRMQQRVERQAVYLGLRNAALQIDSWPVNPPGFVTVGVSVQGQSYTYSAKAPEMTPGQSFSVRTVTTKYEMVEPFLRAWTAKDDEAIGHMLGYPECCIKFFEDTWNKGLIDPNEKTEYSGTRSIYCNGYLRWLGIRAVPHMPCSLDCVATTVQGIDYVSMYDYPERDWLIDLLCMPFKYDTLHGVAEITTPIFKIACSSQGRRVLEIPGAQPDGAASGDRFPFVKDYWTLNGFIGPASMSRAHDIVTSICPKAKLAVDFGCGNGYFLSQLPVVQGIGIDNNMAAIIQGRSLFKAITFLPGNIFEVKVPSHDLSLVSLARFMEVDNPWPLIENLADDAVIYVYSDHVGMFDELREKYLAGWTIVSEVRESFASAAHVRRVK